MSKVYEAFAKDNNLLQRILSVTQETPQHIKLFEDIAVYHLTHRSSAHSSNGISHDVEEPSNKKRKLVNGSLPIGTPYQQNLSRQVILEVRDVSFSIPQRKKLHLNIVRYLQDLNSPTTTFAICLRNPATNEIELEVPTNQFGYALRLPVPEKSQKQYNFCLLPKVDAQGQPTTESFIWTINHGPLKSYSISDPAFEKIAVGPEDVLAKALDFVFQKTGITLTFPTESEFASATPESHRKGEKAYHVKAFRGSKDGYLFFLQNGIFFGFKKPLSFFGFEDIESISYTSVLQRTFNLNIAYKPSASAEVQEIEFAMLDQADFPGIDTYIKRHQLQDASMAEARRAQKLKANKSANAVNGDAADTEEPSELEKAQQQIEEEEDEEDEMEEDYDPGEDGDSDDSGSSSDGEEYDDSYPKSNGRDLVKEELGSEAEEVESEEGEDEDEEEEEQGDEEQEEEVVDEHAPDPEDEDQL